MATRRGAEAELLEEEVEMDSVTRIQSSKWPMACMDSGRTPP